MADILDVLDIRDRSGSELIAICPVHDDSSPSAWINPDKGVWHCFSCGAGGSLEALAKGLGVTWAEPDPVRQAIAAMETLVDELDDDDTPAIDLRRYRVPTDYWSQQRGFGGDTVRSFELGYDAAHHAGMIPVRGWSGELVGTILRLIDPPEGEPKYLYSKGFRKSQVLYGAHLAKHHRHLVVVEGALDAIACWDVGVPAVAVLGARPSDEQITQLMRIGPERVLLATDNDKAGIAAADMISWELRRRSEIDVVRVGMHWWRYPDPDSTAKRPPTLTAKDLGELPRGVRWSKLRSWSARLDHSSVDG